MRKVRLVTGKEQAFVEEVEVPSFAPAPEVLVWDLRMFVRLSDERYLEALHYFVPPQPASEGR